MVCRQETRRRQMHTAMVTSHAIFVGSVSTGSTPLTAINPHAAAHQGNSGGRPGQARKALHNYSAAERAT